VGIPEVVEYAYGVLAYSIVSEYKEGSFSIQAIIGFGYIDKDLIERFACTVHKLHLEFGFHTGCRTALLGKESMHIWVEGYVHT